MTDVCPHGSTAQREIIEALPAYQGQAQRHRCALCAYAAGQRKAIEEVHAMLGNLLARRDNS